MSISREVADQVTISLAIESVELTPSILTARLGVQADEEWIVGGDRGKTGKQWDQGGFALPRNPSNLNGLT